MPTNFPSVMPNTNGNKLIDPVEWTATTANATGTLTAFNPTVVPYGSSTAATTLPTPGGTATTFGTNSGGSTAASVILVGTAANPITISGTVAFDGDVIIQGVVQGTGELLVKGNLYIVGDLKYND